MWHAAIAPYLKFKIKTSGSDIFWWCDADRRQTRDHLFKECRGWKAEIKSLWQRVEKEVRWRHYRHKPILALFNDKKATGVILEFLDKSGVGKMRGGLEPEEIARD
jgi:hypothetical protein